MAHHRSDHENLRSQGLRYRSDHDVSMTTSRVSGHALLNEGAAFDDDGKRKEFGRFYGLNTSGEGRAKCSCGELSEVLPSATKRRAWHRQHKSEASS